MESDKKLSNDLIFNGFFFFSKRRGDGPRRGSISSSRMESRLYPIVDYSSKQVRLFVSPCRDCWLTGNCLCCAVAVAVVSGPGNTPSLSFRCHRSTSILFIHGNKRRRVSPPFLLLVYCCLLRSSFAVRRSPFTDSTPSSLCMHRRRGAESFTFTIQLPLEHTVHLVYNVLNVIERKIELGSMPSSNQCPIESVLLFIDWLVSWHDIT